MEKSNEYIRLQEINTELQIQLDEANDIIHAIRTGEVDALVVNGKEGHQLFTLKSADQTYRIFIEQMTESALTLDESGLILYSNSRFAALCAVPLEKVIGMKLSDFIVDEDKAFANEVMVDAWETDTRAEMRLKNTEGVEIDVQLSLKALQLDEGTALSIIITDLTELKNNQKLLQLQNEELEQAKQIAIEVNENLENLIKLRTSELVSKNEELANANRFQLEINSRLSVALDKLKESEDNLQSAFNAGGLGSCRVDFRTGKSEISTRFRALCGLPEHGDIDWHEVLKVIEPEYVQDVNRTLEQCFKWGTPLDITFPITHLVSGDRRWMRIVGKVKAGREGGFESIYAVMMDVTDQKQDEQRKNDFIAMVSHELKTPLTSMKGYIQVIQLKAKLGENSFAERALEGAGRQIERMTNMINGFLNLSRLESGKMVMEFRPIELSAVVKDIIEEYKTTHADNRVFSNCEPGLFINGDADKLDHVINNLISNAFKYSPSNSNIYIECFEQDGKAVFKIKDEGIGIPAENLPNLFERFYRVESTHTKTIAGFGIGLYLSAEIINRHNGTIWVESKVNEGSVFYFSIPLLKS